MGHPAVEGFALGWEYLTPRLVPERPRAEQTGPDPARMAFASSQRASPTHTHLHLGDTPRCASAGATRRTGTLRAGGTARSVRQRRVFGGGGCRWPLPRKVLGAPGRAQGVPWSSFTSSVLVPCLRPAHRGKAGPASARLVWRGGVAARFRPEGFPPAVTRRALLQATSLLQSGSVCPAPWE